MTYTDLSSHVTAETVAFYDAWSRKCLYFVLSNKCNLFCHKKLIGCHVYHVNFYHWNKGEIWELIHIAVVTYSIYSSCKFVSAVPIAFSRSRMFTSHIEGESTHLVSRTNSELSVVKEMCDPRYKRLESGGNEHKIGHWRLR